jgi:hypothetical protein
MGAPPSPALAGGEIPSAAIAPASTAARRHAAPRETRRRAESCAASEAGDEDDDEYEPDKPGAPDDPAQ